jgi:hypothetical protein
MVLKYLHHLLFSASLFALVVTYGCEDNPDECYSNSDCPKGCTCKATYYNSGKRSGGYCEVPDGAQCIPGEEKKTDSAVANDGATAGRGVAGESAAGSGGESVAGSGGSTGGTEAQEDSGF